MGIKSLLTLKPLVVRCFQFAPVKVIVSLMLMLSSSLASGVGILLIVPLLASVGVDVGGGSAASGVARTLNELTAKLGITLHLESVLGLYLLLIIVMAALSFVSSVVLASLRQSFIVDLRDELSRALFFTQWRYLNREHMSDFMRLITGQVQSVGASLQLLLTLTNSVILVAVYLLFALALSAKLTAIALLCGLGLAALLWPVNKKIHDSGNIGLLANKDIHRSVFDNMGSLKIIKSFAAENRYLQRMAVSNKLMEEQLIRMAKFNGLTRFVNMVGAAVIFTALFYIAIKWLALPVANLLVVLFIFSRLMPQISSIQSTIQSLIHQAPKYQDLLDRSADLASWAEQVDDSIAAPRLNDTLVFDNLSYQYLDNQLKAFEGISATVQRNETVAIVGPSGVGKSTLADLISGLLAPTSGQILVDGVAINERTRLAWRKRVAYVTQEVFLFHQSVRDNLNWVCDLETFDDGQVPEERLWQVLELAAADEFVRSLPQGLDTLIGDRGVKLSGGERQRLALARALLSDPDILILDEATSALDRDNELKIRDALINLEGKLTMFIIAHNETTIEHVAQRINFVDIAVV